MCCVVWAFLFAVKGKNTVIIIVKEVSSLRFVLGDIACWHVIILWKKNTQSTLFVGVIYYDHVNNWLMHFLVNSQELIVK